jgi:hypothetical protein
MPDRHNRMGNGPTPPRTFRTSRQRFPAARSPGRHDRTDHLDRYASPSPLGRAPPAPDKADIFHRYARTRLLSVMAFPSGHVLSWLGSRAAARSG